MVRVAQAGTQLVTSVQVQVPGEGPPPGCAGRHGHVTDSQPCPLDQLLQRQSGKALLGYHSFSEQPLAFLSPAPVLSPVNRLGRVCRQPRTRLLPSRPVHQPGGLLYLPVPDCPGCQPLPSRPGLCWWVSLPPALSPQLWALPPLGTWGRGRADFSIRHEGTVPKAHHPIRNPRKWF